MIYLCTIGALPEFTHTHTHTHTHSHTRTHTHTQTHTHTHPHFHINAQTIYCPLFCVGALSGHTHSHSHFHTSASTNNTLPAFPAGALPGQRT